MVVGCLILFQVMHKCSGQRQLLLPLSKINCRVQTLLSASAVSEHAVLSRINGGQWISACQPDCQYEIMRALNGNINECCILSFSAGVEWWRKVIYSSFQFDSWAVWWFSLVSGTLCIAKDFWWNSRGGNWCAGQCERMENTHPQ